MAFTRKFLKALGIEEDKIDTIMEEHTAVTDGLVKARDGYKAEADKLPGVQKQLDDLKAADDGIDYKQKYEDLKNATAAEKARAGKEAGYKAMLQAAGVKEKFWSLILKANAADIDQLEMDGDKVKGADTKIEALKTSLADYIGETTVTGTEVGTPPGGTEGDTDLGDLDMAAYIAARNKK